MPDDEDDIVERLRSPEVLFTDGQMISPVAWVAATEIEKLREVLKFIVAYSDSHEAARAAARQALGEVKPLEDRWDNE